MHGLRLTRIFHPDPTSTNGLNTGHLPDTLLPTLPVTVHCQKVKELLCSRSAHAPQLQGEPHLTPLATTCPHLIDNELQETNLYDSL